MIEKFFMISTFLIGIVFIFFLIATFTDKKTIKKIFTITFYPIWIIASFPMIIEFFKKIKDSSTFLDIITNILIMIFFIVWYGIGGKVLVQTANVGNEKESGEGK